MKPLDRFRLRATIAVEILPPRVAQALRGAPDCLAVAVSYMDKAVESLEDAARSIATDGVPPLRRAILEADLRGLALLIACRVHSDATARALAVQAIDDELALYPLRDRLEELCEDASALNSLMPPREAVTPVDLDEIPY